MTEGAIHKIDLLNCDCMDYMKDLPDMFFDLAIVDPPYGINAPNMQMGSHPTRSRNDGYGSGPAVSTAKRLKGRLNTGSGKLKNRILNTANCDWDFVPPGEDYFSELFRISKNQIVWGGNYFTDYLPQSRCWVCWDKVQPWENFSQFELAWTSFDGPAAMFKYSNIGGANRETKIHPTQKPKQLYKFLLNKFAYQGEKVFDSHGGSMSIAIACDELGFPLVLCEIDKKYYDDGVKRYQNHKKQLKIF